MRLLLLVMAVLGYARLSAQPFHCALNGKLLMETGEVFPFRLELTDSAGQLTGYSYTFAAPNDTKTLLKVGMDKDRGILSIKETEIIYSNSHTSTAFLCMISARLERRNGLLSGSFSSKELDNTSCTPGRIEFGNREEVEQAFGSHSKYDVAITMGGPKKRDTAKIATEQTRTTTADTEPIKITAGTSSSLDWNTDSLVVELYDGGTFDGDQVTVLYDGVAALKKYTLMKQKRHLVFPVNGTQSHTLTIVAEEEGSDPPATASIILYDGAVSHHILAYNAKKASSMITIKRSAVLKR